MKKTIKIAIITLASLLGILAIFLFSMPRIYSWYMTQKIEKNIAQIEARYLEDAKNTLGGDTPEETWLKYKEAVAKNDIETALKYVFLEERGKYAEYLKNIEYIKKINSLDSNISSSTAISCSGDAKICNEAKVYKLNYFQKSDEVIQIGNVDIVSKSGYMDYSLLFYKNLLNKWQLN